MGVKPPENLSLVVMTRVSRSSVLGFRWTRTEDAFMPAFIY